MRHQYVAKTTDRYMAWRKVQLDSDQDTRFREILSWLKTAEDYATPLHAVFDLVRDLRQRGEIREVAVICFKLIDEYRDYQVFIGKVDKTWRFFKNLPVELGLAAAPKEGDESEATTQG